MKVPAAVIHVYGTGVRRIVWREHNNSKATCTSMNPLGFLPLWLITLFSFFVPLPLLLQFQLLASALFKSGSDFTTLGEYCVSEELHDVPFDNYS